MHFEKPFTQQEPIPEEAISRAVDVMRSGRLHRYNIVAGETAEVSLLEKEFAAWQGAKYCLATASGGQALQIALRAAGVKPGNKVLANAYTLAPVPGSIFAVGAKPIFVEVDANWHTDIENLRSKAETSKAQFLMLSHMRGHIADMYEINRICKEFNITMIEDCAHTMGARWKGERSGNFGEIACFSTQTYKHMNSGEGGLLTTNNAQFAARAIITSGSYMIYGTHGAAPAEKAFRQVKLKSPNCSARMDNLRAAILRPQLTQLEANVKRWNDLYKTLESELTEATNITICARKHYEDYVGSSIQFHITTNENDSIPEFIQRCLTRGVELKWFGSEEPVGFTSRYDSWRYLEDNVDLPQTTNVLSTTCDMRVPLTFNKDDCRKIAQIIKEEVTRE